MNHSRLTSSASSDTNVRMLRISPNAVWTICTGRKVGLALHLLDQVVELRPLEEDQVELVGVAHDQELDAVGDLLLQQLLADVASGAEDVADGADAELQADQQEHARQRLRCPRPMLTAATTSSISSLEIHTRAAGRTPCTRLSTARLAVSGALASQTSPSTRRKPCQVVRGVGPQRAAATSAGRCRPAAAAGAGACGAVGVVGQPNARRGGRADVVRDRARRPAGPPMPSSRRGCISRGASAPCAITSGSSARRPFGPLVCCCGSAATSAYSRSIQASALRRARSAADCCRA